MKGVVIAGVLGVATVARAESVDQLTQTAHTIASEGHCDAVPAIGQRVAALDRAYYASVFSIDPIISACLTPDQAPRSPGVALSLSLFPTAAGAVLATVGGKDSNVAAGVSGAALLLIGPTLGHVYAGDTTNVGLAVRATGGLAALAGLALFGTCLDRCDSEARADVGIGLMVIGGAAYVGGSLWEIGTAPAAAQRHNREHAHDTALVFTGTGFAIAGRF